MSGWHRENPDLVGTDADPLDPSFGGFDEDFRDEDYDPRERHGFGVCVRHTCIEPCGPNGGCIRGS